jgi:hypothetical protein
LDEFITYYASSKVGLGGPSPKMFGIHGMECFQVPVFVEGIITARLDSNLDAFFIEKYSSECEMHLLYDTGRFTSQVCIAIALRFFEVLG